MSQLVETGFITQYSIINIRSIKVTESGDMNGTKYGGSVKVKSINVSQEDDDKFGLVEKETILEFRIPCDDSKLKDFNLFLRQLQKERRVLTVSGTLPRDAGKDTFTVTTLETADQLMARVAEEAKTVAPKEK